MIHSRRIWRAGTREWLSHDRDFGLDCNALVVFSEIFVWKKKWVFSRKLLFLDLSSFALGLRLLIAVFWCWIQLCLGIRILVCRAAIWGLFKSSFLRFLLLHKAFCIVAVATMAGRGAAWRRFARSASSNFSASSFCDVVIVAAKRTPIGSFHGSLASVSATRLGSLAIAGG